MDADSPIKFLEAPFVFHVQSTLEDELHLAKYSRRVLAGQTSQTPIGLVALVIGSVIAVPYGLFLAQNVSRDILAYVGGSIVVLGLLLALIAPSLERQIIRNRLRKCPSTFLTINEQTFIIQNSIGNSNRGWDALKLVGDTPKGLLFWFRSSPKFLWLPNRSIDQNRMRRQVLQLAELKGVKILDV